MNLICTGLVTVILIFIPHERELKLLVLKKKTCILLEQKYLNISQSDVPRSSVDKG